MHSSQSLFQRRGAPQCRLAQHCHAPCEGGGAVLCSGTYDLRCGFWRQRERSNGERSPFSAPSPAHYGRGVSGPASAGTPARPGRRTLKGLDCAKFPRPLDGRLRRISSAWQVGEWVGEWASCVHVYICVCVRVCVCWSVCVSPGRCEASERAGCNLRAFVSVVFDGNSWKAQQRYRLQPSVGQLRTMAASAVCLFFRKRKQKAQGEPRLKRVRPSSSPPARRAADWLPSDARAHRRVDV